MNVFLKVIRFFLVASTAIISALLWSTALAAKPKKPTNIVLIVADYLGYKDIGPYGASDIKTPSLDLLAKQGLRYTHYYSASPVCRSSRAALMSGYYPSKVLTRSKKGVGLRSEKNTLVSELKKGGYATALVGKWHLGSESNFKPTDHGFDLFYGFDSWTLGYHTHLTSEGEPGLFRNEKLIEEDGYLTELFSNEASKFIDSNAKKPFFLYLAYNAALPPYQGLKLGKSKWNSGWDVEKAKRSDYVSMVEAMDKGIGQVLATLNKYGLSENTLVIFTYDHGGRNLVDNGPLFHGFSTLWEGGVRVPLIMRWPQKIAGGGKVDKPAIAMDLTATMLEPKNRSWITKVYASS